MFEISGHDIANLGDADLRFLVARLALAELKSKGLPRSSVTAGGNQDAADGGLDVRVECPTEIVDPDFVPRRLTGFQVKKPDMPVSAILEEMRPKGVMRPVIRELANASGAYVIVSSQGSVADKPLADRRNAMRAAINDIPSAKQLRTDFYGRDRLANWVNEYPGIVAWVRSSVGRPLSGWSGISNWEGGSANADPYLSNDKACLIDECSPERKHLTILEGIARLRDGARTPKQCIRLIGLSGFGKTRLVQALFEDGVGEEPLDSSIAVYTDYSTETVPTARDMARELTARGQRAILVVDNCNPSTHAELARICSGESSNVSLITVEYDVRDDEPEHTEVFRLQSAAPELVSEWISQNFRHISQLDRRKIAEMSDGNFRVARKLAETLDKGETLGSLKSRDLFERIFRQRNEPAPQLLKDAEDLSLLYSIDGVDVSDEGELGRVGSIRGIGALQLYESLVEMRKRDVVQARGRFRAVLPQAIANPLAAHALDRIPTGHFDQFCTKLTPRMLKSVSRRIGFLHDSAAAQAVVARWLQADGPLGDLMAKGDGGFQIISNIAPVAPEAVLAKLEKDLDHEFARQQTCVSLSPCPPRRNQWFRLIKAIGYDARLFDRAVNLLAHFLGGQRDGESNDSVLEAFSDFFHISLSGTQATPEQRRQAIRRLAASGNAGSQRCVLIALRALIKSNHFTASGTDDFGARSRDWGWQPKNQNERGDWFKEAILLVVELAPEANVRVLLADGWRGLWYYSDCREALDFAASVFVQTRPWIEGWIAARATLRYDRKEMLEDARTKLEQLANRLKPTDLLNQARAVVLKRMPGVGGWDFADGEDDEGDAIKSYEKADQMAQEIGRALATDATIRSEFLPELLGQSQPLRAFEFGRGLAEGSDELNAIWSELVSAYGAAESKTRSATALGGFVYEAHKRDTIFSSLALDGIISNTDLLPNLPYLQARAEIDVEGISRLRRAITEGGLIAWNFKSIANRSVEHSPAEALVALLKDIATLTHGVEMALDILHMQFFCTRDKGVEPQKQLVLVGRELLARSSFSGDTPLDDFGGGNLIACCLVGEDGRSAACKVCVNIRSALDS